MTKHGHIPLVKPLTTTTLLLLTAAVSPRPDTDRARGRHRRFAGARYRGRPRRSATEPSARPAIDTAPASGRRARRRAARRRSLAAGGRGAGLCAGRGAPRAPRSRRECFPGRRPYRGEREPPSSDSTRSSDGSTAPGDHRQAEPARAADASPSDDRRITTTERPHSRRSMHTRARSAELLVNHARPLPAPSDITIPPELRRSRSTAPCRISPMERFGYVPECYLCQASTGPRVGEMQTGGERPRPLMRLRPILAVVAACALLFAVSFAVGRGSREEDKPGEGPPVRTAFPVESLPAPGVRGLALGHAPSLPALRTPPRRREPAPQPTGPGPGAAPIVESVAEAVPDSASPPPSAPASGPPPAAPPPAPVEETQPAATPPPARSFSRSSAAAPTPDSRPSLPRRTADPAPSGVGGSGYYEDDG